MRTRLLLLFLCFSISFSSVAQDSTGVNKKRLKTIVYTGTGVYAIGLVGLNALWYKNSEQTNFHFFNDNSQWLQVDKVGHSFTAYQLSRFANEAFLWSGLDQNKSAFWGSMIGMIYQTPIEILDGFSADYGASWGDLVANTTGAGLFYVQQSAWGEQRLTMKYSFTQTSYPSYRPELLGSSTIEQLIKDYNAQTYWLSANIHSFATQSNIPKWINLALGYGANGMISGDQETNKANGFSPYRQFYLSPDIDLTQIPTNKKWVKSVLFILNTIKVPLPALEMNSSGLSFKPIQF